uniref:EB domain-containing protein n=1 Tax=Heligmosomoides polygyrus TaxID=6339 RepID=A0A183GI52_HELPZ
LYEELQNRTRSLSALVRLPALVRCNSYFTLGSSPQSVYPLFLLMNHGSVPPHNHHVSEGIDACCGEHTSCYDQRTPQKICDDNFCMCVHGAASSMPSCMFHATNFCATARAFGGLQYNKQRP